MKKILTLILLIVSTNVYSEWTKIGSSSSVFNFSGLSGRKHDVIGYVDLKTIEKKGNKVALETLIDYEPYEVMSFKVVYVLDCEIRTMKEVASLTYSENMGLGDVISEDLLSERKSIAIRTDTVDEKLFNVACGKK